MRFGGIATWLVLVLSGCGRVVADEPDKAGPSHKSTAVGIARRDTTTFRTPAGFQVELVYAVPHETQGSWVALAVDHQGRLIASDQLGRLYRVTMRPDHVVDVVPIDLPIGYAHGLLYAFQSLYVVVAENRNQGPGLYRVRDQNGDDTFDTVELLLRLDGTGEHGPHSVIPGPDGRSLYLCAGNKTRLPAGDFRSRIPRHWGEDDLLPRIGGPLGSEAGTPAPGGWIARIEPDGSRLELIAIGFRNPFDVAVNRAGELFTAEADAEFDLGTPWYQPTRVFHVTSGTDFGWRSGSAKWPPYFADTLPPVVELGPGSPTGVTFGYGAKFPTRYQEALFVCDWSYGRVCTVQLSPRGSSYQGQVEDFLSGTPLPITDLVINPRDGAMYFTLGGRGTTSGLYRLQYVGQPDPPADRNVESEALALRRQLESSHRSDAGRDGIALAWDHLADADRFIRHAARLALEHAPAEIWRQRALNESLPEARLTALLALARAGDRSLLPRILVSLGQVPWERLDRDGRLTLLRCYEVALQRMAAVELLETDDDPCQPTRRRLEIVFPSSDPLIDAELCRLLVFLRSDRVPVVAADLLRKSVTREEQLRWLMPLRHQRAGWTPELRREYFTWLRRAGEWSGGMSLSRYVESIRSDALAAAPAAERTELAAILGGSSAPASVVAPARPFVRKWSLADLNPIRLEDLGTRDVRRGRELFATASCFACHRIAADGGTLGPDLTAAGRRFSPSDLLEAIVVPDKFISDQFAMTTITSHDGTVITGRIVNFAQDQFVVQTEMLRPTKLERIPRNQINEIQTARVSPMPSGLLDTFTRDEILDLLAFLVHER